ncbi:MAG: AmmeMemoRadiSam system protein B, partial [Acidobacteria bacterium]
MRHEISHRRPCNRCMAFLAILLAACSASVPGQVASAPDREIREPIGPGQFYSRDRARLQAGLRALLEDAVPPRLDPPLAIVAPHAGYIYSGQIAADAYKQVAGRAYETVIILGTNHTTPPFRQVAMFAGAGFRTPLGVAAVDEDLRSALMKADSRFVLNSAVHEKEHSVEVQVPFVQHLFPKARVLPVVVGSS